MIPRSCITILTVAFCLTNVFISCGQSQSKKVGQIVNKNANNLQFDTSKTAIISFDKKGTYPFDNSSKSTALTQNDIYNVDSLLKLARPTIVIR